MVNEPSTLVEGDKETPQKEKKKTEAQIKNEEMLEKIRVATEKLDKANAKYARNKAEAEAEKIDAQLDGEGEAGVEIKKKEITDKEYADKVMAGETPKK